MPEDDEDENEEAHKLLSEGDTEDVTEIEENKKTGNGSFLEEEVKKTDQFEVEASIKC
jgi:hypothetical protein